jgi:maleate isomerase
MAVAPTEIVDVTPNPHRGRARVGLIVPALNTTTEPEFMWLAPAGVSVHTARVAMTQSTAEDLRRMNAELHDAVRLLACVEPDVIAYACTAATFLDGPAALTAMHQTLSPAGRWWAVTTSEFMIAALRHLRVQRVALASPYPRDITDREIAFLSQAGFEVVADACLGLSGKAIGAVGFAEIDALVRAADHSTAEAIFVSCTDLRALELVRGLEERLGKPVLTSNQVTFWGIFQTLGVDFHPPRAGRLLASRG